MLGKPDWQMVGRFAVPASHPCLPGHFPGRPLVPGVLLLEEALSLLLARYPGMVLAGIPVAKFPAPLAPGETVELRCGAPAEGRIDCLCRVEGATVARFSAQLVPAA